VPKRRLPVVLTPDEVRAVFAHLDGVHLLLARLLYGTGLRITEALQLRVKDVDFGQHAVFVREGKGGKDRVVMLAGALTADLRGQLAARRWHGRHGGAQPARPVGAAARDEPLSCATVPLAPLGPTRPIATCAASD
jgi:integrase